MTLIPPGRPRSGVSDGPQPNASIRVPSLVAGVSLAVMAVISPLGLLIALPAGRTEVAALIVLAVAALDVVVGIALVPVLAPGGVLLAQIAAAMRIAYAAVLAAASGWLISPVDEPRFQAIWNAGLLIFGLHLVLVGIAALRTGIIPYWVSTLVVLAGLGYVVDSAATILSPASGISISSATFVGELVLLGWLIACGGRGPTARQSHDRRQTSDSAG